MPLDEITGTNPCFCSFFVISKPRCNVRMSPNKQDFHSGFITLISHLFKQPAHILINALFQFVGFAGEEGQFLMESFELLFEIEICEGALGNTIIATCIEHPALRGNMVDNRDFAKTGDIRVDPIGKVLGYQGRAASVGLDWLATVEARDIGQEFDLFGRKFAVRAIDLLVDMAGIDEQQLIKFGEHTTELPSPP